MLVNLFRSYPRKIAKRSASTFSKVYLTTNHNHFHLGLYVYVVVYNLNLTFAVSELLNAEGVCYAKKDFNLAKHPEIDVPNLQVIKLMQSFKSREYVRETFAWMNYYWFLTNDGIEFLRTYLNLPSEIVPATLKKQAKPPGRPFGGPQGDRPRYYHLICVYFFFFLGFLMIMWMVVNWLICV